MEKQQENTVTLPWSKETSSARLATLYISDEQFRDAFDKDPKAAIAGASGGEVPSDLEIVVHRNDEKCWHVTLPSKELVEMISDADLTSDDGLLSDDDLDGMAGGASMLSSEERLRYYTEVQAEGAEYITIADWKERERNQPARAIMGHIMNLIPSSFPFLKP